MITLYAVMIEDFNGNKDDCGYGSHYAYPDRVFLTAEQANAYAMEKAIEMWESGDNGWTEFIDWKFWCGTAGMDMNCGRIVMTDKNDQWVKFYVERTEMED